MAEFYPDSEHCSSQEGITGLIEPINTRITDHRYFLDSPHQGKTLMVKL